MQKQGARPLFASAKLQACRSICGWTLKPSFAASPARSTILAKPVEVKGAPRSDVKTNGELGSCSRGDAAVRVTRRPGWDVCSTMPFLAVRTAS